MSNKYYTKHLYCGTFQAYMNKCGENKIKSLSKNLILCIDDILCMDPPL